MGVLQCAGCGTQVRGAPQEDDERARSAPPARRRPLPDDGHPENYVLDSATAEQLRQMLEGEAADPEG